MRADLHTLFDLGLIGIDPTTMSVLLAPSLRQTVYAELLGRKISAPAPTADMPSKSALEWHKREHHL